MQDTSREGDDKMAEGNTGKSSVAQQTYEALDELLKAVGNLSLNYITARPPLHKAVEQGHEVIDEAVREGRYVVPSGE